MWLKYRALRGQGTSLMNSGEEVLGSPRRTKHEAAEWELGRDKMGG